MHYCCFVFTKEFPTDEVLEKALKPFSENLFYENEENEQEQKEYPEFMWDYYKIGGRYSGRLKLKVEENNEKYQWKFYYNGGRNGKLFRSQLIEIINKFKNNHRDGWMFSEEDVYSEIGYNDGYIRVDACLVSDVLNKQEISCYCFLDNEGNAYSKEKWNGENFEKREDFEDVLKRTIKESEDYYLCVVDLHD